MELADMIVESATALKKQEDDNRAVKVQIYFFDTDEAFELDILPTERYLYISSGHAKFRVPPCDVAGYESAIKHVLREGVLGPGGDPAQFSVPRSFSIRASMEQDRKLLLHHEFPQSNVYDAAWPLLEPLRLVWS